MEAATSTMHHPYNLGPLGSNPLHGAQQGPHQSATRPPGVPRPEEQHHKPFFYVQPSQPYMPMQSLQWPLPVPMPMSYNPYYGYPGLGYGMQMMPNYQPNPFMEPPSFVVPHTHLHLMDYRRILNPQYYQTMAYHSRRFRYQHNSQTREMTTSEVQTEPLSATQRTSTPGSSNVVASVGLPDHSTNSPSVPTSQPISPTLAVQSRDQSLELKEMAPPSTSRMSPNGSFVIQTEEVRIECCTTPVGLQVLHSHETAEVSHSFSQDMVQCSTILQGHVVQDQGPCFPADPPEEELQTCPDILLVMSPSDGEKISASEEDSRNQMETVILLSNTGTQVEANANHQETGGQDLGMTSNNLPCSVSDVSFHSKYLDELQKMDSTIWSMEETLIASPELLVQNDNTESCDEMLAVVPDVPSLKIKEALAEEVFSMMEMPSPTADQLDDRVPTLEGPGNEMFPKADICPLAVAPVAEATPMTELTYAANAEYAPYLLSDSSPLKAEKTQHRPETNVQDHQDTSFESLPAYLPSTNWLADFDNVYYCSKLPPTPKKQNRLSNQCVEVPSRRRKLDLDYNEQSSVRKPKERYKPKGKVDRRSLSDHECCRSRNFDENAFAPFVPKRDRLCTRCLSKRRICTSATPAIDVQTSKRKAVPFQQRNDVILPTCDACKCHSKTRGVRKGSSPDVCGGQYGHDTEGESSENSSCRFRTKWSPADDPRNINNVKRTLASKQNLVAYPAATFPKLREKNFVSNEPPNQTVAWERLHQCPHGNAIREMDENCAMPVSLQEKWRNMDQHQIYLTHRWQTEKSWKALIPKPDVSGYKSEARSQHLNKHKKSQPQSQGTLRKDTRC